MRPTRPDVTAVDSGPEEPHRVVELEVRDQVAAIGGSRATRPRVTPRTGQQEQTIRHVDAASDGARRDRVPVPLGQAGDRGRVRLLELRGLAAPDLGNDDERLGGVRRVDRQRAIVVPQVERSGLAQPLDAAPGLADQYLHVAVEGDEALATSHLERVATADAPDDAHRALGQLLVAKQLSDLHLRRAGEAARDGRLRPRPPQCDQGDGRQEHPGDDEHGEDESDRHSGRRILTRPGRRRCRG